MIINTLRILWFKHLNSLPVIKFASIYALLRTTLMNDFVCTENINIELSL